MTNFPDIALSVRQPWAWAIVAGHKKIENRSAGAVRSGRMDCRRIAVHAAVGLKQDEFHWGAWRLQKHGVNCPQPTALVRGAIIGAVDVVDIVTRSDSEWFGGQCGLVLENAEMCAPIPCRGELGYFRWAPAGDVAPAAKWMKDWGAGQGGLFDDLPMAWSRPPQKPFGSKKSKER